MKFKGTQKEWFNDLPSSTRLNGALTNACDVANEDGNYIATVYGNTPKICTANATLITAAHELLVALQCLTANYQRVLTLKGMKDATNAIPFSEAVINKALGKTS